MRGFFGFKFKCQHTGDNSFGKNKYYANITNIK